MNLNKKNVKYLNLTIGLAITLCFQAALAQGLKIPGMGQPSGTGTSTGSPIAPSVGSSKTGLRASSSQVDAVAPTPETQKRVLQVLVKPPQVNGIRNIQILLSP